MRITAGIDVGSTYTKAVIVDEYGAMIGRGAAMKAIFDKLAKTAPTSGRVLITGENGTGKELVARAIHEQ